MQTVTIATFNSEPPAERLKQWLETAGVPTRIRNQRFLQSLWFLAKPYAAFHLDVEKDHYEQASSLLSKWQDRKQALAEAIRCPKCSSMRVEYPQMTRKFLLPTLIAHVGTMLGITKHQFFCVECQHTWVRPLKMGRRSVAPPH